MAQCAAGVKPSALEKAGQSQLLLLRGRKQAIMSCLRPVFCARAQTQAICVLAVADFQGNTL
jgi:hypothetical protein